MAILIIKKLEQYNSPDLNHVGIDFINSNYANDKILDCGGWGSSCLIYDDVFRNGGGENNSRLVEVMPYYQDNNLAKYFSMEVSTQYYLLIQGTIKRDGITNEPTQTPAGSSTLKPTKKRFAEGVSIEELPISKIDWYGNDYFAAQSINYECGIDPSRKNNDFTVESDFDRININDKAQTIYQYLISHGYPDSFCAWDDNWTFETHDIVVMNGEVLNHELGYDEIFSWHLLHDKPTFFVKNKGKYQISLDGKLIPLAYDEIFHHDWCPGWACDVTNSKNPRTDGTKTWFLARRENTWFMVVFSIN